jgi:hypothetical protein
MWFTLLKNKVSCVLFFSWDVFVVNPVIFGCYHGIPPPKVRLLSNKFGPGSLLYILSLLFFKKKKKEKKERKRSRVRISWFCGKI